MPADSLTFLLCAFAVACGTPETEPDTATAAVLVGKASVAWYWHRGEWLQLQGSD